MGVRRRAVRERLERERKYREQSEAFDLCLRNLKSVVDNAIAEGLTHLSAEQFATRLALTQASQSDASAESAERVARKDFEAAQNKYMSYSHAVDRASLSLMAALKANGQCVICEKPQDDCEDGDDHVVRACAAEPKVPFDEGTEAKRSGLYRTLRRLLSKPCVADRRNKVAAIVERLLGL